MASIPDANPVTDGHLLVIPTRHVERIEQLSSDEWHEMFGLVRSLSVQLGLDPAVDGLNIGINSGRAAGQTVPHAHIHVIPRRVGDCDDPRGGVRWVIPPSAAYWEAESDGQS